jgi:hypothetical protein
MVMAAHSREGAGTMFLAMDVTNGCALARELEGTRSCRFYEGSVANEANCAAFVTEVEKAFEPVSMG